MSVCVQGRPVYIQLLGKIDIHTLKQITTEERMIKFHIQEYERCGKVIMPICSRLAGRQIDQTFGIMDVKGERAQDGLQAASGSVPAHAAAWRQTSSRKRPKGISAGLPGPAQHTAAPKHGHCFLCCVRGIINCVLCVCFSVNQVWGSATCLVR